MDPNHQPSGPQSDLRHEPAGIPSRSSSRRDPATPDEVGQQADGYFEPLSTTASRRSRLSTLSINRRASRSLASESAASGAERSRRPSIRIRRSSVGLPNSQTYPQRSESYQLDQRDHGTDSAPRGNRPRSTSQPGPAPGGNNAGGFARNSRRQPQIALPRLTEEGSRPTMAELGMAGTSPISPSISAPMSGLQRSHSDTEMEIAGPGEQEGKPAKGRLSRMIWPSFRRASVGQAPAEQLSPEEEEYNEELVDWLDIVDPEVQTLSTLTNVQNSLFIPDLGRWVNRRPTYVLSQQDSRLLRPASRRESLPPADVREQPEEERRQEEEDQEEQTDERPYIGRSNTITSRLSESHYAALPHGQSLEGWTAAEKFELDDRVRHMLHSRRAKFKRQMKGFGQYVRRPLGFFVTLYAVLITLFGLAWVLFLIGWIYVGDKNKQRYTIHIIDSVLVALFAIMGDGLIPFRARDTYHMIFIVRYSRIIEKHEKQVKKGLITPSSKAMIDTDGKAKIIQKQEKEPTEPQQLGSVPLQGEAEATQLGQTRLDIPAITVDGGGPPRNLDADLEDAKSSSDLEEEYDPLTPKQRKSLEHHQKKLSRSHSFYKPYETFTHHSFPLGYLMAIIILLDCHSALQVSLGACTWGISYHTRPFAITTVILCVSITCNVTAGLVISRGDKKTRKKDVVELLDRQALTGDAIKKVEHKRKKKEKEQGKMDDDTGSEEQFSRTTT